MINKKRLVQTFLDLVTIDSPSGEEDKIREELAKRLTALGVDVKRDTYGNLVAKISGEGEPFLINGHLDTVEPGRGIKPVIDGDIIRSDGTTILGSDPKAGLCAILEALASIREDNKKTRSLEIVLTIGEETGLFGAMNLDYRSIHATQGVTFDGEFGVECVDSAAPGYNRIDARIIGRGAHAGAEPEKGISAIKIASEIIAELELGRIDHETTANIGLIKGGSARNAVPEEVFLEGEIRSRSVTKLDKHTKHFEDIFTKYDKKYPDAKVEMTVEKEFHPYVILPSHPVVVHLDKIYKKMGLQKVFEPTGGGSDVNIFHAHGIQVVDVGTGGGSMHTTREYVLISEMVKTAIFCETLIREDALSL